MVKNIAVNCRSRGGGQPYTVAGLGDRIHTLLLMYQYSMHHNIEVNVHLSSRQWGDNDKKNNSWKELLELIPKGYINLINHPVGDLLENEWIIYLRKQGYADVETYYYFNKVPVATFEITQYIKTLPEIDVEDLSEYMNLPDKYVTEQWDSQDQSRSINPSQVASVRKIYEDMGYEIVTINGGELHIEQKKPFPSNSIKHIAYCMKHAEYHIGANSGFFHLAHLYKPYEKIRVYTNRPHDHVTRAQQNGSKVNYLL